VAEVRWAEREPRDVRGLAGGQQPFGDQQASDGLLGSGRQAGGQVK
jgi:hypothetical protein